MSAARHRLTGRLTVALPPDEAFRLFTARGEQAWVPRWEPHFPAAVTDDAEPGTVFQTHAHDETTTWIVVDSTPGRHIRYARVTPNTSAGTVTVTLTESGDHTEVAVTYELTALTETAADDLSRFADDYPTFLTTWQTAIAEASS
ncbi:SRPBCC family protein [Actinomadura darangshiensis]|uniref:SRPBCC family protein n=1 Tax=Actinomadura darangshiensis TaxID=705336 RepID=A0A4R5ADE3_9ACTN|nr:SRPBCC family protein [Actinomadura darangshiensis]TDD68854.1 SRPBCC family protein [Actinomadura darangshiensis]